MSIMETIKENPLIVGGVALVVILLVMRGGSSSGNAQGQAIAASLESQRIASGLNAQLSGYAADVVKTQTAARAEMYMTGLEASNNLAKMKSGDELAIYAAYMQGEENRRAVDASRAVGLAQIDAGKVVALSGNATQIELQNQQIVGAQRMTDALIAADAARRGDQYRSDQQVLSYNNAGLATMLQHEQNLAHLTIGAQVGLAGMGHEANYRLADLASRTQIGLADIDNSLAREKSHQQYELEMYKLHSQRRIDTVESGGKINDGVLKWFTGGINFSDRRLKENIRFTGQHSPRGFRLYTYNFIGSTVQEVGVMADEVLAVDASAVAVHSSGYHMVDYSKV
jgi:hypothetical protein